MDIMKDLKIFRRDGYAYLPTFATDDSHCFDIFASLPQNGGFIQGFDTQNKPVNRLVDLGAVVKIYPQDRVLVPTGLYMDIPEKHCVKLYVRSGISFKRGLILTNGTGIVDADYVEEVFISLTNNTNAVVEIHHGERIAQGELVEKLEYQITELQARPSPKTQRTGGFGSTGTK